MSSVKRNIYWSSILTVSGYLFPLITYPYITRVLGVDKIGICNFVDSIINYGILISMMGMTTLGIREIAQAKDDKKKLSSVFTSLVTLNFITSLLIILILLGVMPFVQKFHDYQKLFYIGAAKILFNALMVEWLYTGLENFRFITLRSLIFKVIYVLSIFAFIKCSEDYVKYFAINTSLIIVNSLANILYSKKFVQFSFRNLHLKKYLVPFFLLGVYMLLTSMYTSFNVAYLGFACGTVEVGYYTTAVKLYTLILAFITAFTNVMMPRMSSLLAEEKRDDFLRLINKSVDVLLTFVVPMVIIGFVFSESIIRIIAGTGFEGAIIPMRIIMPLLLVIGYEQILVIQILMPLKKDKSILVNSVFGALVGLTLNFLIVPLLNSSGSAIVWVASELTVLFFSQYYVSKYISYSFPFIKLIKRLLWAIPAIATCVILNIYITSYVLSLIGGIVVVCVYFGILEFYYYKNTFLRVAFDNVRTMMNSSR
jgi:O-antigen/teichoic acid export membrane protein